MSNAVSVRSTPVGGPSRHQDSPSRPVAAKKSNWRPAGVIGIYTALAALLVWTFAPVAVMIGTSLKPNSEIFAIPPRLLPTHPTLSNYVHVFTASSMPHAFLNSIAVGLVVTAATMILATSAGYALARFRFRGARAFALFLLLGQMLPLTVLLVPLYQMVNAAHLLDTVMGLGFAHLVVTLPLVTWMVRNQIAAVPIELEDAVCIDGGSRLDAVLYVTLPVTAPGMVAAGMFSFLQSWHEFLLASAMTVSEQSRTAPVALTEFASDVNVDWGSTMAAATVLTVPIVVIFMALQRYFVRGLTSGAVKG